MRSSKTANIVIPVRIRAVFFDTLSLTLSEILPFTRPDLATSTEVLRVGRFLQSTNSVVLVGNSLRCAVLIRSIFIFTSPMFLFIRIPGFLIEIPPIIFAIILTDTTNSVVGDSLRAAVVIWFFIFTFPVFPPIPPHSIRPDTVNHSFIEFYDEYEVSSDISSGQDDAQ